MVSRAAPAREPPFLLRLPTTTPEGRVYLAGLLALGILGNLSDRNFVLLTVAALLAVVLVSVAFSSANVRGLSVSRSLPETVRPGEVFYVTITILNRSRWFPARGILVKDALQTGRSGPASCCFAPSIPAGQRVVFTYPARIRRRGVYGISVTLLTTRFPFGLFVKHRIVSDASRIVVHPRTFNLHAGELPECGAASAAVDARAARLRGSEVVSGIRDYRPGDDFRRIAWKATAHHGHPMLKELEDERPARLAVLFASDGGTGAAFEPAVSLAASVVRHLARRRRPFLFVAPDFSCEVATGGSGGAAVLEYLATVAREPAVGLSRLIRATGPHVLARRDVIAVVPGDVAGGPRTVEGIRVVMIPPRARSPEPPRQGGHP